MAIRFGFLPRRILQRVRRFRGSILDVFHWVANRGESALPPPSLRMAGGGDFHLVGVNNVRNIKRFTALDGKTILEIGCGSGRNALALASYDVTYNGLDIVESSIDWCTANISRLDPRFSFHHADVFNGAYNHRGTIFPEDFRFPYENGAFDLVVLTSVFTHMLEPEAMNYLREIARVLKPGGGVYATFFLLNGEANDLIAAGRSSLRLQYADGRSKVHDSSIPELSVGHDEAAIMEAMHSVGLSDMDIRYGSWCGRRAHFDYQDVIFAVRT